MSKWIQLSLIIITYLIIVKPAISQNTTMDYRLQQALESIEKTKEEIEQYQPGRKYLAGEYNEKWLLVALSPKARMKWYDREMVRGNNMEPFDKAYASLLSAIKTKIKDHKPDPKNFTFRNTAHEEAMKAGLDNIQSLTIHKIGFIDDQWQKTGSTNPPFKRGYIWAKDNNDDYLYCHLYEIKLNQVYIGDGKYEGDGIATITDDIVVACP